MQYKTTNIRKQVLNIFPGATDPVNVLYPNGCPHCKEINTPKLLNVCVPSTPAKEYTVLFHKCSNVECEKVFLSVYQTRSRTPVVLDFITIVPDFPIDEYSNPLVEGCSPTFVNLYNQALAAEHHDLVDLSAAGHRMALDTLIKDYAIKERGANQESMSKVSLDKLIATYFSDVVMLYNSADVIRLLGNNYVHSKPPTTEDDFHNIKVYFSIFLRRIESDLLALHPPVRRPDHSTGK